MTPTGRSAAMQLWEKSNTARRHRSARVIKEEKRTSLAPSYDCFFLFH